MKHRKSFSYDFEQSELNNLKLKMLNWIQPFSIFSFLDNNGYQHQPNRFEMLVAVGIHQQLPLFPESVGDWVFGHVAYDFKNQVNPALKSKNPDDSGFEDCRFFIPQTVVYIPFGVNKIVVESMDPDAERILNDILNQDTHTPEMRRTAMDWQFSTTKAAYLEKIKTIQNHIVEGDFYELNYCSKVHAETENFDPFAVFQELNTINPSPFAAFYKNKDSYLISASPERFLYKSDLMIVSQPIKGTISRLEKETDDMLQKEILHNDEKERAENVMIVDLMRNDLAQCCEVGTIKVPELFGVYSFPQLHHLISTVEGQLLPNQSLYDIFKVTFPMGSMTGAPKRMVMEMIEHYELARRGLYSGTLGYIMPNGDFDFNVVIRSLIYNANNRILSYQTGGAITFDSHPEKEWAELKLKAKAIKNMFN